MREYSEYTLYVHFTCCVQCTKIPFDLNLSGGNFLGTFEAFKMPQQILGGKIGPSGLRHAPSSEEVV